MRRFARQYGRPGKPFAPSALAWIDAHSWPGNVRELENLVHREFLLADGDEIALCEAVAPEALPQPALSQSLPFELGYRGARAFVIAELERSFAVRALAESGGNVSAAARLLGKERRAFGKLLKKHGIDRSTFLRD
jgi:DNA-binding NtrC family response regulator